MLFPNHTLTLIMCLHLTWCCKNVQFSQTPLLLVRIISMGWDHDIFMVSVIKDSQLIMYSAIMKKVFLPNIMYCTPCSRGRRSYMSVFKLTFFKFWIYENSIQVSRILIVSKNYGRKLSFMLLSWMNS